MPDDWSLEPKRSTVKTQISALIPAYLREWLDVESGRSGKSLSAVLTHYLAIAHHKVTAGEIPSQGSSGPRALAETLRAERLAKGPQNAAPERQE